MIIEVPIALLVVGVVAAILLDVLAVCFMVEKVQVNYSWKLNEFIKNEMEDRRYWQKDQRRLYERKAERNAELAFGMDLDGVDLSALREQQTEYGDSGKRQKSIWDLVECSTPCGRLRLRDIVRQWDKAAEQEEIQGSRRWLEENGDSDMDWDSLSRSLSDLGELARHWAVAHGLLEHIDDVELAHVQREICEALEACHDMVIEEDGTYSFKPDPDCPGRKNVEVELGDAIILIASFAAKRGLNVGGAIEDKMQHLLHKPLPPLAS